MCSDNVSARTVSYSFSFVYIRALGVKIHTYIFFFVYDRFPAILRRVLGLYMKMEE